MFSKKKSKVTGLTAFGTVLSKLRLDADEDASEQSKRLRVSQSFISMASHGKRAITPDFAIKVIRQYKPYLTYMYLTTIVNEVYEQQFKRFVSIMKVNEEPCVLCDFVKMMWGDEIKV